MKDAVVVRFVLPLAVLAFAACGQKYTGGGDLRAQRVVLSREVEGLREAVARLERGEPLLPVNDVGIAIDDALVRDLIAAQLPFEADVDRFRVVLTAAEAQFRGSPVVRLRGEIHPQERPDLAAAVSVLGALEDIGVEPETSTLRARIAVDHIGIEKAAGVEQVLGGAAMDEVARLVRLQLEGRLPPIQIPVKVQQSIELPAVTTGPVRIDGASMPLQVAVSHVFAGQGRLWIAVHVQPGDLVKTKDAPAAGDASAEEAGVSLGGDDDERAGGKPAPKGQGR
jgi:hypothetical protein